MLRNKRRTQIFWAFLCLYAFACFRTALPLRADVYAGKNFELVAYKPSYEARRDQASAFGGHSKIRNLITKEIPERVAQDKAYQNAQANSDRQNAKLEHDRALNRVVLELLADHTELFKQFSDNQNFKRWLTDMVFDVTYQAKPDANTHVAILKERANKTVREKFGDAPIWKKAVAEHGINIS